MTNTPHIRNEDLIIYIAEKLKDSANFGSIMLNKILYYSDNINYQKYGRTISSFKYINQTFGPTPDPSSFLPLRQKLIKEGKVREKINEGIVRSNKKLVALKPYNTSFFSREELEILDSVIKDFKDKSAIELSDISHNELGWQLTENGEEIPFNAFLLSIPELNEEDYIWADEELAKLRPIE